MTDVRVVSARLRCGAPQMAFVWRGPAGYMDEVSIYMDEDGEWHCNGESLGFVKEVFERWLETVVFDVPPKDASDV